MSVFDRLVKGEKPSADLRRSAITKHCSELGLFYPPPCLETNQYTLTATVYASHSADMSQGIQSWREQVFESSVPQQLGAGTELAAGACAGAAFGGNAPFGVNLRSLEPATTGGSSPPSHLSDAESNSSSSSSSSQATLIGDGEVPVAPADSRNPCVEVTSRGYPERGYLLLGGMPTPVEQEQLSAKLQALRNKLQDSYQWKRRHGASTRLITDEEYKRCSKAWNDEALKRAKWLVEVWEDKAMAKRLSQKMVHHGSTAFLNPTPERQEKFVAGTASPLNNTLSMEDWEAEENTDGAVWMWMGDRERASYAAPGAGW